MSLVEFRTRLLAAISTHLPSAQVEVQEKRASVLSVRASVADSLFLDVYHNDLTGKTSYTLIYEGQRIFGYDNYRFWHCHPFGQAEKHVPCQEPETETVLAEIAQVVEFVREHKPEERDDSG